MQKTCDFCSVPFKDEETVLIISPVTYKEIPSRVAYSLSAPREVREIYHEECFLEAFGDIE